MAKSTTRVVLDRLPGVLEGIRKLATTRVMVGIPSDNADRRDGAINNAALGYIHENGAPEVGIPARPFLQPGVRAAQTSIRDGLRKAGELALAGNPEAVDRQLHRVGLAAQASVRRVVNAGVPPPLADSTVQARARRGRKGAQQELARRAKGEAPGTALAKPLVDTAQMRNAITYVIREVR